MAKKLLAVWLLFCLTLAGCENSAEQEPPWLVEYDGGVINTAGQLIIAPPAADAWPYLYNDVLYSQDGRSCYAMQVESQLVEELESLLQPIPEWDGRYFYSTDFFHVSGRTFRFYDCFGELVHSVSVDTDEVPERNLRFCFAPNGDLSQSILLLDQLETNGRYQLLDYNGNLLAEKRGLQGLEGSGVEVTAAPGFLALRYATLDGHWVDFYGWDGQPLQLAQNYFDFEQLNFYGSRQLNKPLFYKARYTNAQGRRRYDILDGEGHVVAGNLLGIKDIGASGVYSVTQGWGNNVSCWLDLRSGRPVWLTENPGRPDYRAYAADDKLIAAMQTEQEYKYIFRIYYGDWRNYGPSPYFEGHRLLEPRGMVYDVLDENGRVLISGVSSVQYIGDDLFIVVRGFSRGLMNAQGEWLYQESIFTDLDD